VLWDASCEEVIVQFGRGFVMWMVQERSWSSSSALPPLPLPPLPHDLLLRCWKRLFAYWYLPLGFRVLLVHQWPNIFPRPSDLYLPVLRFPMSECDETLHLLCCPPMSYY